MDIKGKVFFITGSGQGLGKAYAQAVLSRGGKVFISDMNEKAGNDTLAEFKDKFGADNIRFAVLDVSDLARLEEVFHQCVESFGQVDVMVNNAGVLNESIWEKMIVVNVTALVKGTQLAEAHMRKDKGGKGGRIINISSRVGLTENFAMPVYTGTKQAVRGYTTSMATQPNIEEQGIEYGILCPGPADTDLMKLDTNKVLHHDVFIPFVHGAIMPIEKTSEAFVQLVTLEKMNGAMLYVTRNARTFQKMERVDLGPDFVPGFSTPVS